MSIPGAVTRIAAFAFKGCSSVAAVRIGDSVTTINASAFHNCSSLAAMGPGFRAAVYALLACCMHVTAQGRPSTAAHAAQLADATGAAPEGTAKLQAELVALQAHVECLPDKEKKRRAGQRANRRITEIKAQLGQQARGLRVAAALAASLIAVPKRQRVASFLRSPAATLRLPRGLCEIGEGAFAQCIGLAAVRLPNAFRGCVAATAFEGYSGLPATTKKQLAQMSTRKKMMIDTCIPRDRASSGSGVFVRAARTSALRRVAARVVIRVGWRAASRPSGLVPRVKTCATHQPPSQPARPSSGRFATRPRWNCCHAPTPPTSTSAALSARTPPPLSSCARTASSLIDICCASLP